MALFLEGGAHVSVTSNRENSRLLLSGGISAAWFPSHSLFWIENAPRIDVNTDEEVVCFIDEYVTCELPTQDEKLSDGHICALSVTSIFPGQRLQGHLC